MPDQQQLIERVAQAVLGWHRQWYRETTATVVGPERWRWEDDTFKQVASEYWNPFEDAAADYLVLENVRREWSEDDGVECASKLQGILALRNIQDYETYWIEENLFMLYAPGDYSRAALAVLDAKGRKDAK